MISIVDDDEHVRGATADLLYSLGYHAIAFDSAEAFLDSPHAKTTACLILDQQLPGMQGHQLQEHLCVTGAPAAVIIITAFSNREGHERALSGGAVAYLTKPYEQNALIQALDTALKR